MDRFKLKEKIPTPVLRNGWHIPDAEVAVNAEGLKPIIGRDLFDQLLSSKDTQINNIVTHCPVKELVATQFPEHICIGRSNNNIAESKFNKNFQPSRQKGSRIPIKFQNKLNLELTKFLDEKSQEKTNQLFRQIFDFFYRCHR